MHHVGALRRLIGLQRTIVLLLVTPSIARWQGGSDHAEPQNFSVLPDKFFRCREPHDSDGLVDVAKCPGLGQCRGPHSCSWRAIAHALPPSKGARVVEVARRTPWGFAEYGSSRQNVAVANFFTDPAATLAAIARSTAAVFHILVGEGVARDTWQRAVTSAMLGGASEVWVMEHNRLGDSWRNRSAWPTGHQDNPAREMGSEMFTLAELRQTTLALAQRFCKGTPRLIASCPIPTPTDPAGRNILVGVQCHCISSVKHTRNSSKGHFCRHLSEGIGKDRARTMSPEMYNGINYVYTFHADAPMQLLPISRWIKNTFVGSGSHKVQGCLVPSAPRL